MISPRDKKILAAMPKLAAHRVELLLGDVLGCRRTVSVLRGVTCQGFLGAKTDEPSVIGWMPSAQLYFNDPDGHSVELITLLDDTPDPSFIGSLTEWRNKLVRTAGIPYRYRR
jgi:hypothetical protein